MPDHPLRRVPSQARAQRRLAAPRNLARSAPGHEHPELTGPPSAGIAAGCPALAPRRASLIIPAAQTFRLTNRVPGCPGAERQGRLREGPVRPPRDHFGQAVCRGAALDARTGVVLTVEPEDKEG